MSLLLLALLACEEPVEKPTATCDAAAGDICTWAGTGQAAFYGEDQPKEEAMFYYPVDIEMSDRGDPIVVDWNNHRLRSIDAQGHIHTEVGTPFLGDGDPATADLVCPGVAGTTVNLNHPTDVEYTADGKLLIASWHTHKIRLWDPATGLACVHCGTSPGFVGDNWESATGMLMNQPKALAQDADGNLFIIDSRNGRVRELASNFTIDTFSGDGTFGYAGDGGPVESAVFNFPNGPNPTPGGSLAFSPDYRKLYIADSLNNRIRMVDLATGLIDTVVGNGTAGLSGDGGSGRDAMVFEPRDIEVGPDGVMYIADTGNSVIRTWDPATDVIETIAGNGTAGFSGDDGPAVDAMIDQPFGLDIGLDGNVYFADTYNNRIRVIYR